MGFTENRFFIYQNIAQWAKRGTIQKVGCVNDGSVKKAFSADSLRVTQSPSYTTALKEATRSESLLLIGLKRFLCFLMTTVTRITVGKDESTQNVQHLLHFSFSSMEKVYQAPQNTSGMYSWVPQVSLLLPTQNWKRWATEIQIHSLLLMNGSI